MFPANLPGLGTSPGSSWNRDYDLEFSKLLEEIPSRATSAPPHLQDGRWPGGPLDPATQAPRATPTPLEHPNITDIRYDEDYLRFYQEYSGQRKLPPPIDGRTFFQELPGYLQQTRLGSQLNSGPGPGGLTRGGLEVIDEQGPGSFPDGMLQAFQQLGALAALTHVPGLGPITPQVYRAVWLLIISCCMQVAT
ncbi:hypothetical protein DUNSADRAFT_11431 [Dunaliella salina]|uniref:Encoded protein n=1 Tax=Dunaliella salina TaxID=3046 RepID=A0ABQ7FT84_DUNSA|nr:hypothetical protein DUNSADRAFT_11431 [Dunaliella salina]|eukprot:KAF5825338.1 hypothetical protein DUNSADRAFT_11431 [Dunaliella salina]